MPETNLVLNLDNNLEGIKYLPIDKITFSRIISNLVNNAFEAKNSGNHLIKINAKLENNKLNMVIADNGPGIPQESILKIMQQGYSTKGSNRGFGLSYAKAEIEKIGGSITITNCSGLEVQFEINISNRLKTKRSIS